MSNYTAPVEDMGFVLKEVVEIEKLCNETGLDGSTVEILDTVLEAAGKLAKEEIEPINKPGDSEGLQIDGSGKITTAAGFREAYQHFVEGGWGSLQFSPTYGGQGVPFVVAASVQEMWHSANMSWGLPRFLTSRRWNLPIIVLHVIWNSSRIQAIWTDDLNVCGFVRNWPC